MRVLDIVNRASITSGAAPSFNADEVPEDMQARAADILRHEIIPNINCDRTLDITEIVRPFFPINGVVDLRTTPLEYPNAIIGEFERPANVLMKTETVTYGGVDYERMTELMNLIRSLWLVEDSGPTPFSRTIAPPWPADQFGKPRAIALWTVDCKLIEITPLDDTTVSFTSDCVRINRIYNLPFAPMRVSEIYRAVDGTSLNYVHAGEFVSSEFRYSQLVFTTEDYATFCRVRFSRNFGSGAALIVLPVPVTIVNSYAEPNPWEGTLLAPPKFYSYIQGYLTWRMSVEYGLNNKDAMKELADKGYQALLKNPSKKDHPQDIPRKISALLERGRGWRVGTNGNAYVGGFNG